MKGTKIYSLVLAVVFSSFLAVTDVRGYAQLSSDLAQKLDDSSNDETITAIIGLRDLPGNQNVVPPDSITPEYKSSLINHLMSSYASSNKSLLGFLSGRKAAAGDLKITPIWLSNALIVKGKKSVISEIAKNSNIESMHLSRKFYLVDYIPPYDSTDTGDNNDARPEGAYTYGLSKIRIPELAQYFPWVTGKGVRVGHLDTGVNPRHPDLAGKVIAFMDFSRKETNSDNGDYLIRGPEDAYDDNNHGTHTAGTIAGGSTSGTRIGVAIESQLIEGKIFGKDGSADEASILQAMQWVADPDGDPKTNDGAQVVSNSWGGIPGTPEEEKPLWNAVANWVKLGIFPVFAAGNEGPNAESMSTPGGYSISFAIGATDDKDLVASFSSRGPFQFGGYVYNKPDASAPGVNVFSSLAGGKWGKYSGTSMATPHVAGLVALMLQVNPSLRVDQLANYLTYYAKDVDQEGYDFNTGWGRVDAYKTIGNMISTQMELPFP